MIDLGARMRAGSAAVVESTPEAFSSETDPDWATPRSGSSSSKARGGFDVGSSARNRRDRSATFAASTPRSGGGSASFQPALRLASDAPSSASSSLASPRLGGAGGKFVWPSDGSGGGGRTAAAGASMQLVDAAQLASSPSLSSATPPHLHEVASLVQAATLRRLASVRIPTVTPSSSAATAGATQQHLSPTATGAGASADEHGAAASTATLAADGSWLSAYAVAQNVFARRCVQGGASSTRSAH
jgi:hypothetical protein